MKQIHPEIQQSAVTCRETTLDEVPSSPRTPFRSLQASFNASILITHVYFSRYNHCLHLSDPLHPAALQAFCRCEIFAPAPQNLLLFNTFRFLILSMLFLYLFRTILQARRAPATFSRGGEIQISVFCAWKPFSASFRRFRTFLRLKDI